MERYGENMIQSAVPPSEESVEAALRDDLARGDSVLRSATPIMRHLLSGARHPIFADEIVARVRGGLGDIAHQLLDSVAGEPAAHDPAALDAMASALAGSPGLLSHIHGLALEWQLSERLQQRLAIDPVLPPLLQALLASEDATTAALAMNLLAAQARFTQTQRRMQLPLNELPADLLHGALLALRGQAGEPQAGAAEAAIRAGYDESRTRLALIARLVTGMGSGAVAALALSHAGAAIFATALATAAGQERELVVLTANEGQAIRLGLTLRVAGLKQAAIEELLLTLHPGGSPAVDWDRVGTDRASALLAIAVPQGTD